MKAPATDSERLLELARQPFVARKEYFGCLVYDRRNSDYIPFDGEATDIFERSLTQSLGQVYPSVVRYVHSALFQHRDYGERNVSGCCRQFGDARGWQISFRSHNGLFATHALLQSVL